MLRDDSFERVGLGGLEELCKSGHFLNYSRRFVFGL